MADQYGYDDYGPQDLIDLRPTGSRPLVHQSDPQTLDNALQKTAETGMYALPLGLSMTGGPEALTLSRLAPTLIQSLLGPFDHPDPNVMQGVVLSPKNISNIEQQIESMGPLSPLEKAIAFMRLKYPRLSNLALDIVQHDNMRPSDFGSFVPSYYNISRAKYPRSDAFGNVRINQNKWGPSSPLGTPEAVETLGHELTHANQYYRNPNTFEDYVPASVSMDKYWDHPTEVGARQGGTTAKKAYETYEQTRPGNKKSTSSPPQQFYGPAQAKGLR